MKSHMKGTSKKRQHSTIKASILLAIFTFTSIVLRIFSCIIYLTPALGLFNSLRHLQGEMYPHWDPYFYPEDILDFKFHFGTATPMNWSEITRWNYIDSSNADPPQLSLYTYFTIQQHFAILLGIFAFQSVIQSVIKFFSNPTVFKTISWIDHVVHAIYCSFIPIPMEEWDEKGGTVEMHKARKELVFKEHRKAFRRIPRVEAFRAAYRAPQSRRKFLVLDGPSRTGKTEFVRSMVEPVAILELNCASCMDPPMADFDASTHRLVLFGEGSLKWC